MSVGDDETLASSQPTLSGGSSEISEVVAGRYQIIRWLGGGGMGRVYEALDTELGERVALKVLRAGLSEEAIERFRREVRLTRRIQHRNVARMFDIGEHRGDKFLTMELVDGEPLTRRLGRPMPWAQLQPLAIQICEGLAAAHAAGVIHRDLKPDNVLVERKTERVVLTDFGIARSGDDASVTQLGAIVGTPRYMAPEQLAGEEVDARADLFSLGVMLYELATGTRPWTGDNVIAIAVAQATQPAAPLSSSSVPPAYAALVHACLELDRTRRPSTAAEIGATLAGIEAEPARPTSRVSTPTLRTPPRPSLVTTAVPALTTSRFTGEWSGAETSVAVLPFACAPGDDYLADGVVEDVVDTLSTTPTLRVRPSGFARSHAEGDPRALGQQLEVDHVVSGSLRRTPRGLRIAVRLISVADGFQIWARRVECTEAEVLSVSDDVARGIAEALSTRAASDTRTIDPRAVDLYLRARAELRRFWGEHQQAATELLEQAAVFAPSSPQILSALAVASVQAWIRQGEPAQLERARAAVERAVATGYGEAFYAASSLKLNQGLLEESAAALGTAVARAPMSALTQEGAGRILLEVGAAVDGRRHLETSISLDPGRMPAVVGDLARLDALQGNWTSAEQRVSQMLADPDPSLAQVGATFGVRFSMWRRDFARLQAMVPRLGGRVGAEVSSVGRVVARWLEDRSFDSDAWEREVAALFQPARPHRLQIVALQRRCEIALMIEQPAHALSALRRACDAGLIDLVWLDCCPLLLDLRDQREYEAIRAEVADRAGRVLAAFRAAAT